MNEIEETMKRKCADCLKIFEESELHYSHDIPRYMFGGDENERKNKADKYGTHLLCKTCHDIYEKIIFSAMAQCVTDSEKEKMIKRGIEFSKRYFTGIGNIGVKDGHTTITSRLVKTI